MNMDESLEASSGLLSFIRPPAFRAARQLAAIRAKMMNCFSMGWCTCAAKSEIN
jgi:hypothetical protein